MVLDGSKSDCGWRRDPASPVPGLTPIERMPVAIRSDWVHNSNDSFFYTHPAQRFEGISPLVGDASVHRPRTRAGLMRDPRAAGARQGHAGRRCSSSCSPNRNFMARVVLPDLLAACRRRRRPRAEAARRLRRAGRLGPHATTSTPAARTCSASSGARARAIPGVYRVPFDRHSRWPHRPA